MPLREYSGNAKPTSLGGAVSAAATALSVADGAGYPTGVAGPFVVTIDTGLASEEKVLCVSRTGNTLTVAAGGRGFDSTAASDHGNGATVFHTYSATDAREANAHVNDTTGDPHPQYVTPAEGAILYASAGDVVKKAGGDTVTASAAAVRPLVVKGAVSQTANLFEAQDSAGALVAAILSNGQIVGRFHDAAENAVLARRMKVGNAGTGPGGIGRAVYVDS